MQRVRKALDPPGEARDDIEIVYELARRLGHDLGSTKAEDIWNELRSLSPMHAGMSYARLEELGGIQWPCWDDEHRGEQFIHGRLWDDVVVEPAPFMAVEHSPPVDAARRRLPAAAHDRPPARVVQHRRPDRAGSRRRCTSTARRCASRPRTARATGSSTAAARVVASRRGAIEAPVAFDTTLRPGLAFMNLHFPELVDTNVLTIDATDPRSGTAEFKATAIRVDAGWLT